MSVRVAVASTDVRELFNVGDRRPLPTAHDMGGPRPGNPLRVLSVLLHGSRVLSVACLTGSRVAGARVCVFSATRQHLGPGREGPGGGTGPGGRRPRERRLPNTPAGVPGD